MTLSITRRRIVIKCGVVKKKVKYPQVNNRSSSCSSIAATKKKRILPKCTVDGCTNNASDRERCRHKGCNKYAQKGGVCITHGAKVKRCSFDGCTNHAQKGGVCYTHGATRKQCSHERCTNGAIRRGVCWIHGAKVEVKRCSVEGCNNKAIRGGVCWTHNAKGEVKRCSFVGCTSNAQGKGGLCHRHRSRSSINANNNPTLQPNAVTPANPSCESEEEEELINSWIWRSYTRPSQQKKGTVGSQKLPESSKTKAKKGNNMRNTNNTPTSSSERCLSGRTTEILSHEQDERLCILCEDAKKVVVLLPCKHMTLCTKCASTCLFKTLHECPMCRVQIKDSMEIYW
jgi:hypothetical protein